MLLVEAHFARGQRHEIGWVFAWVFGPESNYIKKSAYSALSGVQISCQAWAPCFKLTVAEQLDKLLRDGAGLDVVVVTGAHDWADAAKIDEDARRCLDRARTTEPEYYRPDDSSPLDFAAAAVAVGVSVSVPGPPPVAEALECLECGATYSEPGHVEPGGMSCDRCGK